MDSVAEIWREIPGHEGSYEASNLGRVRSLDRIVEQPLPNGTIRLKRWRGRVLTQTLRYDGYLVLKLGKCLYQYGVHQLIARTFIGPQGDKVVNHIDGIKANNVPENLEYITSPENVKHAYRTGLLNNDGPNNGRWKDGKRSRKQTA